MNSNSRGESQSRANKFKTLVPCGSSGGRTRRGRRLIIYYHGPVFDVNRFYPKTQLSWLARLDHSHCNSADPLTDRLEVCCVFYRPGPGCNFSEQLLACLRPSSPQRRAQHALLPTQHTRIAEYLTGRFSLPFCASPAPRHAGAARHHDQILLCRWQRHPSGACLPPAAANHVRTATPLCGLTNLVRKAPSLFRTGTGPGRSMMAPTSGTRRCLSGCRSPQSPS